MGLRDKCPQFFGRYLNPIAIMRGGGRLRLPYRLVSATIGNVLPCLSMSSFSVIIVCSGVHFRTVEFSIAISIFLRLPIESKKICASTCFLSSNASVADSSEKFCWYSTVILGRFWHTFSFFRALQSVILGRFWQAFSFFRALQSVASSRFHIFSKHFLIFLIERIPTTVPLTIENMDRLVDRRSISLLKDAGLVMSKFLKSHSPLKVINRQLKNTE